MTTPPQTANSEQRSAVGVALKPQHGPDILAGRPDVGLFEIHAENYMGWGGPPHRLLAEIASRYPLSIHGVGLSLGSAEGIDGDHLNRLAALVFRYEPVLVSEHLAWSVHNGRYLGDLLPLPYTAEAVSLVAEHVDRLQSRLRRQILLENPATYLSFEESVFEEVDFIAEITRTTGCGLLLDLNNVWVASVNRGSDPRAYLAAFPIQSVKEIHLAGHTARMDAGGAPLLIDSHDQPVCEEVWQLYAEVVARTGPMATVIERDANIPSWLELYEEVRRAQLCQLKSHGESKRGADC